MRRFIIFFLTFVLNVLFLSKSFSSNFFGRYPLSLTSFSTRPSVSLESGFKLLVFPWITNNWAIILYTLRISWALKLKNQSGDIQPIAASPLKNLWLNFSWVWRAVIELESINCYPINFHSRLLIKHINVTKTALMRYTNPP